MSAVGLAETAPPGLSLLSLSEQRILAVKLTLSLIAGGLLLVVLALELGFPAEGALAELVAGAAAALVAVPVVGSAWHSLRHPDLHGVTDQLIAIALIAAWAEGDLLTAALLPIAMLLGHVLEERSLLGSQEAIEALARLTRSNARQLASGGAVEEVRADELRVGDVIELRPGDRVPADGVVLSGRSAIDTAPITGESVPVEVAPGASAFAGSINFDGRLTLEITRVGGETTLGRVIALMRAAERSKPPVTRLLERYAGRYIVLVLLAAAGTWFVTKDAQAMLAVVVASCPCALVLAAPATAIAAIAVAGRHGILIKGAAFLEELATVDGVVLDKTGTLTLGELVLTEILPAPGADPEAVLELAASLAAGSSHPISRAVRAARPAAAAPVEDLREVPGQGLVARLDGAPVAFGRPGLFAELGLAPGEPPPHDGPIAGVALGTVFLGWLLLADEPRREARAALDDLRALGLPRQILLTGDRAQVAARVGLFLGVPEVCAEALPEDKLERVLQEVRAGHRPMVVGDGINDALALKAGAVGVAMGAQGTDAALASADVVLMTADLRRLGTSIRLSRRCRRTIHTNVAIGFGWTLLIIGLAAGGLLGANGALAAAVLHNVGTLAVMANAGRLLKFHEVLKPV